MKIKIMPESPETDMGNMEKEAREVLEKEGVKNPGFEIQPIAFGLKAIVATFGWPEEKELDELEDKLSKIKDANSVQVIDIRRAIG